MVYQLRKGHDTVFAALASLVIFCAPASSADAPGSAGNPTASPPSASTSPEIIVKQTKAAQVVYREHVGPYWTVGPVFAEVQAYMLEHDGQGPMYIRYLDNPSSVAADKLRAEIGFFVDGDHQPKKPYQSAIRRSEPVAVMSVAGPIAAPPRYIAILRRWAMARGHAAMGPVTEIFPQSHTPGAADRAIEVQMAIRPLTSKWTPVADQFQAKSAQNMTVVAVGTEAKHAARPGERASSHGDTDPADSAPTAKADSQTRSGVAASVHGLARQHRFDRIAELLMPPGTPFPPAFQLWFGQVVFRIGGIAGGIRQLYPAEESALTALSEAIRSRYDVVAADFALDPRDEPVLRVDSHSDGYATRKRAIMRELDTILGGIAFTRLDADAAEGKVIDVVQRMYDLLRTARSVASTRGAQ